MADCPNVETQKIEYDGLKTISRSKLLRAEIDSIDATNNCASITLLDQCDASSAFDFSATPFDYLCEGQPDRSNESLSVGYKAFDSGDMVYLLFLPEPDSAGNRAYIVGHIDIRDTKRCFVREYFYMQLTGDAYTGDTTNFVTIFDAENGCTLDLESFSNKDAGSPPKPVAFPCVKTEEFDAWFSYNFSKVVDLQDNVFSVVPFAGVSPYTYAWDSNYREGCPETWLYYNYYDRTYTLLGTTWYEYTEELYSNRQATYYDNGDVKTCEYLEIHKTYDKDVYSGNTSGWRFTDIAGGTGTISIFGHVTTKHTAVWDGDVDNPSLTEADLRFTVTLKYPYQIPEIGTDEITTFEIHQVDAEVNASVLPYRLDRIAMWPPPDASYPLNTTSDFLGETGFFYVMPYYFGNLNEADLTRYMAIVSLKKDIGEITEENPETIVRYLQNIDYSKSVALGNSVRDLYAIFEYAENATLYRYLYTCPIQLKG